MASAIELCSDRWTGHLSWVYSNLVVLFSTQPNPETGFIKISFSLLNLMDFPIFSIKTIAICLVLVGTVFLFVSILAGRDVQKKVPAQFFLKWRILTLLICFFLFCYFGYIFIRLTNINFPLELLTGVVFFAGSLFVYGMIGSCSKYHNSTGREQ